MILSIMTLSITVKAAIMTLIIITLSITVKAAKNSIYLYLCKI